MKTTFVLRVLAGTFLGVTAIATTIAADVPPEKAENTLRQKLEQASAAEGRGETESARAIYVRATELYPAFAEAWAALGEHLRFYVHDADAATVAFRKAIAAEHQDPYAAAYAWRGLGELEIKAGREDAGIGFFKKSLEAYALADTHRSLCHLYCHQRKFKEAAEQARCAVELSPNDAIARMLYAAQLQRAGDTELARKEYEKALLAGGMDSHGESKEPVHCCVLYNAAGYLSVSGQNDAALKMLQRFFETPNHRHLTRDEVVTDADFESLKDLPAFRKMIEVNFK